jgi:hypothetical protein
MTDEAVRPPERAWILGCACGSELFMVNCKPTLIGPGCDSCRDDVTGNPLQDGEPWTMLVQHEAGWCCCGDEDRIDTLMWRYLIHLGPGALGTYTGDVEALLAYLADSLGWTEHGTAVDYPWLTDAGREARDNLAAHLGMTPDPPSEET